MFRFPNFTYVFHVIRVLWRTRGQLNNNQQDIGVNMGDDELIYLPLGMEECDMDAFVGDEAHLNTDQAMGGEEHNINKGSSSKPVKRFTVEQLQQLES
jgi:homeobox-leucine zipper protein